MSVKIEAVRGTKDVLPAESYKWRYVEKKATETALRYGFDEVRFPTFEKTELFRRGVGETTDVVQKEMYTFETKGGDSITLRPEGTASVARLCLENGLFAGLLPLKLFYIISCFRYEKPQAGRYREFHQFGVELYGSQDPRSDVEVISLVRDFLASLGLDHVEVRLNSIGCPSCRAEYRKALIAFFEERKDRLCETCRDRLYRNPMRILDCKCPECRKAAEGAPVITDYLCEECRTHFERVRGGLTDAGILFTVDPGIIRGLDYYTKTVFEFVDADTGLAILGGGRYDGLIHELDGKLDVCGIGFAAGLERLIALMESKGLSFGEKPACRIFLAGLGEQGEKKAAELTGKLRRAGISASSDISGRSLKAQMKYADHIGAAYTMVLGDDEIAAGEADLRRMSDGEKRKVSLSCPENWF